MTKIGSAPIPSQYAAIASSRSANSARIDAYSSVVQMGWSTSLRVALRGGRRSIRWRSQVSSTSRHSGENRSTAVSAAGEYSEGISSW